MATEAETAANQSWRCRLDNRWTLRDRNRLSRHSGPRALSRFELPAVAFIPGPESRLERRGLRSMDSALCDQYPRGGTMLARVCPATSGGRLGTGRMVGKWHLMVPLPLEFRVADPRNVAADHAGTPVDCAAEAEHFGGHHHSRDLQRRGLSSGHERSRCRVGRAAGSFVATTLEPAFHRLRYTHLALRFSYI